MRCKEASCDRSSEWLTLPLLFYYYLWSLVVDMNACCAFPFSCVFLRTFVVLPTQTSVKLLVGRILSVSPKCEMNFKWCLGILHQAVSLSCPLSKDSHSDLRHTHSLSKICDNSMIKRTFELYRLKLISNWSNSRAQASFAFLYSPHNSINK